MKDAANAIVLRNAHVIDPAHDIDRVLDVTIEGGKILAVGDHPVPAGAEIIDLGGAYLSPGWIDVHVHAYGTLGFADPDSIGIYQGVTTFVEAGGPGVGTFDEFAATMEGRTTTSLYAGIYIRPMGIIGLSFIEDDIRNWMDIPIERWLDCLAEHRDTIRYLKIGAFNKYGPGPLKLAKGLAEILELPLYTHIGEFGGKTGERPTHEIFRIAEAGDIITHLYHKNFGHVLDADGRVAPAVRDAERRGVLFDIGFGGFNFSWEIAEQAYAQDLVPHLISSDLQQFNVIGPTLSLANVLSVFLRLGMPLRDIVERITINPARALGLTDRAGSLRVGMPADLTVFRLESGAFELADCVSTSRTAELRVTPVAAYKDGIRFACDLERAHDESNWFLQIADDHVPAAVRSFTPQQLDFLRALTHRLQTIEWHVVAPDRPDLRKATELQAAIRDAMDDTALPLAGALKAIYGSFLDSPFSIQAGLFLIRLDRAFVLERLVEVTAQVAA